MAAFDLEEQERIDALKDWWKQNGTAVYTGVAVFILAVAGIKGWQYYRANRVATVAERYAEFDKVVQGREAKRIREAAQPIMKEFADSPWATRAAFEAGAASFAAGDLPAAQESLQWAVDHAPSPALKGVARLRLAAVLFDQKKYPEALKLLDDNAGPAFAALTADLKGDIFAAQGKAAEARASYQLVLDKSPADWPGRQLTQIKLDGLGGGK